MFEVKKWIEIDAGHRVPYHASKCKNLHGHRYRIEATVRADMLVPDEEARTDSGMVIDFGMLKTFLMQEVHDPYDHKLILWEKDRMCKLLLSGGNPIPSFEIIPVIPTAENLARFWGEKIMRRLRVWEIALNTDLFAGTIPGTVPGAEGYRLSLVSLEVRETPTSTGVWYPPEEADHASS